MRIFYAVLLAATTTVFAIPSPKTGLNLRSAPDNVDSLSLVQVHNITSSVAEDWPTICYQDLLYISVNSKVCSPLIAFIISQPDYTVPRQWLPGHFQSELVVQQCRLRIVSGNVKAWFSLRDIVASIATVLQVCQPPRYTGSGGSTPVAGFKGFMYSSFHVQVTGVRPNE